MRGRNNGRLVFEEQEHISVAWKEITCWTKQKKNNFEVIMQCQYVLMFVRIPKRYELD